MLPTFSLWCDPDAISDPDLLEAIGMLNANAAVGVLCNPHVNGARLERVAANANLLVKSLEMAGYGRALMSGRTTEDQIALVRAAVERSSAAAKMLVRHANPDAALVLFTELDGHRLGTHRAVAEELRGQANHGFVDYLGHPGYARLMAVLGDHAQTSLWLAVSAAFRATTTQELCDLAPQLAAVEQRGSSPIAFGVLQASLWRRRGASSHWLRHGGDLGARVASLDHEVEPDALVSALDQNLVRGERDMVVSSLLENPRMPKDRKRQWLMEEFVTRMDASLDTGASWYSRDLTEAIEASVNQRGGFLDEMNPDNGPLLAETARRLIRGYGRRQLSLLMLLDLMAAVVENNHDDETRYQVLDALLDRLPARVPPHVAEFLLDVIGEELPYEVPGMNVAGSQELARKANRLLCTGRESRFTSPRPPRRDADLRWKTFASEPSFMGPGSSAVHAYADVAAELPTLEHLQELYHQVNDPEFKKHTEFNEVLASTLAAVAFNSDADPALAGLLPDALGAL